MSLQLVLDPVLFPRPLTFKSLLQEVVKHLSNFHYFCPEETDVTCLNDWTPVALISMVMNVFGFMTF